MSIIFHKMCISISKIPNKSSSDFNTQKYMDALHHKLSQKKIIYTELSWLTTLSKLTINAPMLDAITDS